MDEPYLLLLFSLPRLLLPIRGPAQRAPSGASERAAARERRCKNRRVFAPELPPNPLRYENLAPIPVPGTSWIPRNLPSDFGRKPKVFEHPRPLLKFRNFGNFTKIPEFKQGSGMTRSSSDSCIPPLPRRSKSDKICSNLRYFISSIKLSDLFRSDQIDQI